MDDDDDDDDDAFNELPIKRRTNKTNNKLRKIKEASRRQRKRKVPLRIIPIRTTTIIIIRKWKRYTQQNVCIVNWFRIFGREKKVCKRTLENGKEKKKKRHKKRPTMVIRNLFTFEILNGKTKRSLLKNQQLKQEPKVSFFLSIQHLWWFHLHLPIIALYLCSHWHCCNLCAQTVFPI